MSGKNNRKRLVVKTMLIALGAVLAMLLTLFVVLLSWSPGKSIPYLDDNGHVLESSISEISRLEIGGIEQGMIIKSKNAENPVLLFLHGGPGNPEYVLAKDYPIGLEEHFTVCWWDQRGAGMSYSSSISTESVTLQQMISDTIEVTNYLRERFGKEKIYIMGHSWGSFLGVNTVSRHPELYEAYIGIGQVTNQLESEKLGYVHMLETARTEGDTKLESKLLEYTLTNPKSITPDYLMIRSAGMSKQGNGVFHVAKSQFNDILLPIFQSREYTLGDKYGYLMGSLFSLKCPINKVQYTTNLFDEITELNVPVYIFHGAFDMQVSYKLSKEYFEMLNAPQKQFYTFDNSAHSPFMEEPEKFIEIIKTDVLGQ